MASGFRQELYSNPTYPTQQPGDAKSPPPPPPIVHSTHQPSTQQYTYVQPQTTYVDRNTTTSLRTFIPEFSLGLAITLAIINFIIPGFGTIIAGFCVLCCGNVGESGKSRFGTFCINFWIGIAQVLLIGFGLGWPWSIYWGIAFIAIAAAGKKRRKNENHRAVITSQQNLPVA